MDILKKWLLGCTSATRCTQIYLSQMLTARECISRKYLSPYFYFGPCEVVWMSMQNAELIESRGHTEEQSTDPQNYIVMGSLPTMMLDRWPRCSLV